MNNFYSEGKIIEGGPDIYNEIKICSLQSDNNKIHCLDKIAQSTYHYFFKQLSMIRTDKHNKRIQSITSKFLKDLNSTDTLNKEYLRSINIFKQIKPGKLHGLKDATSGSYVSTISKMLYMNGFDMLNETLSKANRSYLEGTSPDTQCENVLGYLDGNERCYICNIKLEEIQDTLGCPTACEHVVNVFQALKFYVGLYNSNSTDDSKKLLKNIVYKWSCACCNYAKNQLNFIDTTTNAVWTVKTPAIRKVLKIVSGKEIILVKNTEDKIECCREQHKKIDVNKLTNDVNTQMTKVCKELNENYPINNILIKNMVPEDRILSLKILEFICVISNISRNGMQKIFNKVASNYSKTSKVKFPVKTANKNSKAIKTSRPSVKVKPTYEIEPKIFKKRVRGGDNEDMIIDIDENNENYDEEEFTHWIEKYIDETNVEEIYELLVNELNIQIEEELSYIQFLYADQNLQLQLLLKLSEDIKIEERQKEAEKELYSQPVFLPTEITQTAGKKVIHLKSSKVTKKKIASPIKRRGGKKYKKTIKKRK
mgnify:CR=1 FL=1